MGLIQEYKEFISRGNVVDLAVAVVIGAAFGKIVDSFVKDLLMPPIGMLMGGKDFSSMKYTLQDAVVEGGKVTQEAVAIGYGSFINTIIQFLIIAFGVFIAVKMVNKIQAPAEAPGPTSEELLTEIRDLLKR